MYRLMLVEDDEPLSALVAESLASYEFSVNHSPLGGARLVLRIPSCRA